ncbi:MAG TPA: hypothetical protein VK530_05745 [Candidatus Acidoferrum sp.]|nr:hypothetical protein [Candidatus Acidoferrum sp.]
MNEMIARYEQMVQQFPQNELALGNKACAKAAFEKALQLAIDQNHEGPQMEMEEALGELD